MKLQTQSTFRKKKQLVQKSNLVEAFSAFWLVGDEADALHLADIVESDDADEGVWVSLLGLLELSHHLGRVGGSVHGQLPHCPVPPVVVPGS